jgi:hypothetical protein
MISDDFAAARGKLWKIEAVIPKKKVVIFMGVVC